MLLLCICTFTKQIYLFDKFSSFIRVVFEDFARIQQHQLLTIVTIIGAVKRLLWLNIFQIEYGSNLYQSKRSWSFLRICMLL